MGKTKNEKNENAKQEEVQEQEIREETSSTEEEALSAEQPELSNEEEESLRDQLVRLQADFTNFRNRVQRERTELYQRANEDLFLELLPVLDHYEMGLQTAEKSNTDPAVLDGFRMVYDQFEKVLKHFGVSPIDAVGEEFDPHLHEALTHLPSEEFPAEVCSEQVRRGYLFGEKLLRPAQVVVSSGSAQEEEK